MTSKAKEFEFSDQRNLDTSADALLLPFKRKIQRLKCLLITAVTILLCINIVIICWVVFAANSKPSCATAKADANYNAQYKELFESCYHGEATKVQSLLSTLDLNVTYDEAQHGALIGGHGWAKGTTCLHFASAGGQSDTVMKLLRFANGTLVNVNQQDANGRTPVGMASYHGHLEVVRVLCEQGKADAETGTTVEGFTPLMGAVIANREDVVKYLVEQRRVDINRNDKNGKTALGYAKTDSIKELLNCC